MSPGSQTSNSLIGRLTDAAMTDASDVARNWLISMLNELQKQTESLELLGNNMAITMSKAALHFSDIPVAIELPLANETWQTSHWSAVETVQILIVLAALTANGRSPGMCNSAIIEIAYRFGDDREKASIMKGLPWLDSAGKLVQLAVDAGRTNSEKLFSAIALQNPYPALHYSESQFNRLVMKSLYTGLNIEHVPGLRELKNSELMRMCGEYAMERYVAGRSIPPSLWLTLDCEALPEEILALFLDAMAAEDSKQRYFTARSLTWQANIPEPVREKACEQLAVEPQGYIWSLLVLLID